MPDRVERFLAHLDRISGGIEPRFFPVEADERPRLTALVFDSLPEPGLITGITYGLSLAEHPAWRAGKPELCITVSSDDASWAFATAYVAWAQRGRCPFRYGDAIDFGQPIAAESPMSAFAVMAPAVLQPADYLDIDVGDDLPINISGLYPIHASELRFIGEHGLEEFWRRDWDAFDVRRPPVV